MMLISLEPEPAEELRAAVLARLVAYNRKHAEAPDFNPLVVGARDTNGAIVGGLVGDTGWRWLHVDLLWVADAHRGQGIGRRLLRAAEAEALSRGARRAYLDTFDYQARPFYEREGYEVFGVQEDFPPGHRRFYLRKTLTELHSSATV
jgi:GNAT superfamily N-acetyltransferase